MRMIVVTIVMLMILPCSVVADEWQVATMPHVFSGNGLRFVRIVPGECYGDTVGFKGAKTGDYARGEFYEKQPDRSYKLLADVALQNPVAPVDVLLSNRGYLLTFDNWHNAGYGKVVAIYRPTGERVRSYELEPCIQQNSLRRFRHPCLRLGGDASLSVSSIQTNTHRCMSLSISVERSLLTSLREHTSANQGGRSARRSESVDVLTCRRLVYPIDSSPSRLIG